MTIAQVVKTSVTVNNSPIQDYVHEDDHTQPADVRLVMETTVIMQVAETKFFGVIIDQRLSCRKPHISFFFFKKKGKKSRLLSIIQNVADLISPNIL